ncbi:hypothetical protein ACFW1A_00720 [Kitasatospora sp. NPDC058965]|uniref:hypothetical protein n=1 Tax=Kitasatospora sp. NPDC058965 TaxID=3346682 RepID=UPI0036B6CEED
MPVPQWLQDHMAVNDPMADLNRLGQWLDDAENRVAWHTNRTERESAQCEAEAKLRTRRRLTVGQTVILNGEAKDAKARHQLAELALELAESIRLRTAMTLRSAASELITDDAERELAKAIGAGTRTIMALLTDADFRYPFEAHQTATAVLEELTNSYCARTASRDTHSLEAWAKAVNAAVEILSAAPTIRP